MLGISFVLIFNLLLFLAIPVCIAVYVYRDAGERGMNALLWALIAAFAPVFVGLILYLIVRTDHSALRCPQCGQSVRESYSNCPHCGAALKNRCGSCGYPLEPEWKVCPNCGRVIPKTEQVVPPLQPKKDTGLGKLLAVVVLVPAALCILLVAGLVMNFSGGVAGAVGWSSAAYSNIGQIEDEATWYALYKCSQEDGIYLLYDTSDEVSQRCLVYIPNQVCSVEGNLNSGGLFTRPTMELRLSTEETGLPADCTLRFFEWSADKATRLKLLDENGDAITDYTLIELDGLSNGEWD